MDSIYWIIIIALLCLAMFDLMNGVANDAVNFLNSAIGAKAAPVRVILTVASIGVLVGACFSGGMMEVARNGIFHPCMFSYHEVMLLFLGVMVGEVILLDTFNTFGLPTSTTVSMVFGIMGSAVACAWWKISDLKLTESVLDFINTDKAMGIVSGILLSVAIAFTVGTVVMWLSRLCFSFRYQKRFKWFGFLWCGIAMTAIAYFAIFKGLKESTMLSKETLDFIDNNIGLSILMAFGAFSVLMAVLQHLFMCNILRVTVLAGTFSLALAFAGNDLVNFIGVFTGGLDSFMHVNGIIESGAPVVVDGVTYTAENVKDMPMQFLMPPAEGQPGAKANFFILLAAGTVMVFALWFSKKAKSVIATGVELSRQGDGGIERFGSVPPARAIVRSALALGRGVKRLIPARMLVRMNRQWDPAPMPTNPKDRVAFDLIRATVNLTVASLLIAWATGQKLPLSTTYVTFMVAMGSSLADKAWGRESAVYRITGVLTVISGWFMTALAAFTMAAVMATVLHFGQIYAIFGLLALVAVVLVKSSILHKKRESKLSTERFEQITEDNILEVCTRQVVDNTLKLREIYNDAVESFLQNDRKSLKDLADAADRLAMTSGEQQKYDVLPMLYKMQSRSLDTGYHFVQALEHLSEAGKSLQLFTEGMFTYIDNNHTAFTIEQVSDLREVHDALIKLLDEYCKMLQSGNFEQFDYSMIAQEQFLQLVAKCTKRQIKRAQRNQTKTRSSLLYLNMLNEMRFMAVQVRLLTNDERNFIAA